MYICGPTVYDKATIGNFRTYIFGDILNRILKYNGYEINYVQNITDVGHLVNDLEDSGEDKMEKGSRKMGKSAWEIAKFFEDAYWQDGEKLNIQRPTTSCRATDHIVEQIEMIKTLEQKGFAYKISDGIYFDTGKQKDYGRLAGLDIKGLHKGARVEINPEKKNITDFALWKFSPQNEKRQMEWNSPWGVGFPGWHIECSAMSIKYLGEPFDIHAGGIDLLPVHHTNELAQNEAVYSHKTVNYWLHSGFILIDGHRMGKSLGNAYTIDDIIARGFDPLAYRYLTFSAHYRQELNFTWEALGQANISYMKLLHTATALYPFYNDPTSKIDPDWNEKFSEAINDDLNMPKAIAVVWEMIKNGLNPINLLATLLKFDEVLGFRLVEKVKKIKEVMNRDEVQALIEQRSSMRKNKEFAEADKLRIELQKIIGPDYEIKDQ